MRRRWLLALVLAVPLADTLLLVPVSNAIGLVATVALVVLTGLIGSLLVRAEGRHTIRRFQQKLREGSIPTDEAMDGALLIAAGAFLLTPGLVTDAIGFAFAIPVTRYPIRELLLRAVVRPYVERQTDGFLSGDVYVGGFPDDDTVDLGAGEYRVDEDGD